MLDSPLSPTGEHGDYGVVPAPLTGSALEQRYANWWLPRSSNSILASANL